jgi:hypothetical protein
MQVHKQYVLQLNIIKYSNNSNKMSFYLCVRIYMYIYTYILVKSYKIRTAVGSML